MSAYDEIAEWYDEWVGPQSVEEDPAFRVVESLMGEIAGQRICDLACGQGRASRRLAELGAEVVGVDLSGKLLEIARRYEAAEPRGIDYIQADARSLDGVADRAFDGVVCYMALMDIPDLAPALQSVARVLRPGGWFVFAILHPCFNTARSGEMESPEGWLRTVGSYFVEGWWRSDTRTGPPGKVGSYHRTLSTFVDSLGDAGFALERVSEPRFTDVQAGRRPIWAEVPAILIVRCRMGGRSR
jgi:ubiquinone/menaquinone biosynthesis C-methylase UbiE